MTIQNAFMTDQIKLDFLRTNLSVFFIVDAAPRRRDVYDSHHQITPSDVHTTTNNASPQETTTLAGEKGCPEDTSPPRVSKKTSAFVLFLSPSGIPVYGQPQRNRSASYVLGFCPVALLKFRSTVVSGPGTPLTSPGYRVELNYINEP
jgi:hypothetical protein